MTKIGFFEEAEGVKSMTRLTQFIRIIVACLCSLLLCYGVVFADPSRSLTLIGVTFVLALIVPADVLKLMQRKYEAQP